jgi:hypothetical protein
LLKFTFYLILFLIKVSLLFFLSDKTQKYISISLKNSKPRRVGNERQAGQHWNESEKLSTFAKGLAFALKNYLLLLK